MKKLLILFLTVLLLAGCGRQDSAGGTGTDQNTEPDPVQEPVQEETEMTGDKSTERTVVHVDSLPDALPYAGKTLAELGYTEDDLEEHMYLILETEFLGQKQEIRGFAHSWEDYLIGDLWFLSPQSMADAEAYFTELYGEPFLTGQEPYVASNGGVVFWSEFWTGEGIIRLSKGDRNTHFEFSYYPVAEENKPQEVIKREQGLSLQEFAYGTGYYMDLTREDFDALKIEKIDDGHFTWVFTYEGTDYQFDLYKDQGDNLTDYLSEVNYEKSKTEHEELYTYVEGGYGEQVFVNPFGDVWKIVMNEGASAKKLNDIRTLLEDHSWNKQ